MPLCCYLLQQRTNGNRWPASSLIKDLHWRGKDWPGAETNSSKKGPAGAALSSSLFVFFFPLSFLLHGNRVGVKEMCKHTLVLSTSLSARLNRSHKNMFCTSRTCRRLMLSAACRQKQTLETGLGYHNPPWVPWGRASSAPITLKPLAVGFCMFFCWSHTFFALIDTSPRGCGIMGSSSKRPRVNSNSRKLGRNTTSSFARETDGLMFV